MQIEAKTFKDMTEAELLEIKNNYEANRLITENQLKMFQSQIDIIDNQLKLINEALSNKQKDNDYNI